MKAGTVGGASSISTPTWLQEVISARAGPHFLLSNNMQVPRFDFFWGKRTRVCACRESCRTSGMQNWCRRLQTPQLYKFACMYESINASAALCLPVFVRGCLTALHSWCCGRWRGVCLSPLSDIGDDWNINGLRRAEHKRCPGRFIQQSRGCDAAKSECEWSQTVLSVMFKPAEPSLVFLFEHLSSDYFFSSSLEKD